jgi:hypothetical protein
MLELAAATGEIDLKYLDEDARKFSSYGKSGSTWVCTFSFYQNTAPK